MSDLSAWTVRAVGPDGALVLEKDDVHLGLGPGPVSLSDLLHHANRQDLLMRGIGREVEWQRDQMRLHGISLDVEEPSHGTGVQRVSREEHARLTEGAPIRRISAVRPPRD